MQREAQHSLSSGRGWGEGKFKQGKMDNSDPPHPNIFPPG